MPLPRAAVARPRTIASFNPNIMDDDRLVFVSHSGEDIWVARQIAREIEACGARVFLDEADIGIGSEIDDELRDFLNRADEYFRQLGQRVRRDSPNGS